MPRPRTTRVSQLRRDLAAMGQDLDALYGPPSPVAPDVERDVSTPAVKIPPARMPIDIQAHLLGPEHLGRFIEVRVPSESLKPGITRPAGPLAGRLVGYRAAAQNTGPHAAVPVRSFELLLQQGPSTTTAVVSWADPIRIA